MIREAHISDATAIARIQVLTWQDAYKDIIPEGFLTQLSVEKKTTSWEGQIRDHETQILVCEQDSEVVGFIAGGACRDEDLGEYKEIYALYVDPNHQRQGIGALLTNAFLSSNPHSLWVLSENIPAIQFYEKLGLKADSKTKVLNFGVKKVKEMRMVKL